MNEFQLLAIGALFGLSSGIIIQLVTHIFSSRRDKNNWQRDELRREKQRFEQEKEKLDAELSKRRSKIEELQKEIDRYERATLNSLIYGIILMNQRRDALLGFTQDEQIRRADQMRGILSELDKDELEAIAEEKKPLPELPGKPKSLSS